MTITAFLFIFGIYYWSDKYFTAVDEYNSTTELVYQLNTARLHELSYTQYDLDYEVLKMFDSVDKIFAIIHSHEHKIEGQRHRNMQDFSTELLNYKESFARYVDAHHATEELRDSLSNFSQEALSAFKMLEYNQLENAKQQQLLQQERRSYSNAILKKKQRCQRDSYHCRSRSGLRATLSGKQ